MVNVMGVDLIHRHHQVGPLVAHCRSGLVKSDYDVPRRAGLRGEPSAHLPSFDQNILFERQRINTAEFEDMRPVKQATSVVKGTVERIGPRYAAFQAIRT